MREGEERKGEPGSRGDRWREMSEVEGGAEERDVKTGAETKEGVGGLG